MHERGPPCDADTAPGSALAARRTPAPAAVKAEEPDQAPATAEAAGLPPQADAPHQVRIEGVSSCRICEKTTANALCKAGSCLSTICLHDLASVQYLALPQSKLPVEEACTLERALACCVGAASAPAVGRAAFAGTQGSQESTSAVSPDIVSPAAKCMQACRVRRRRLQSAARRQAHPKRPGARRRPCSTRRRRPQQRPAGRSCAGPLRTPMVRGELALGALRPVAGLEACAAPQMEGRPGWLGHQELGWSGISLHAKRSSLNNEPGTGKLSHG